MHIHTGLIEASFKQGIDEATSFDNFMTTEEAIKFGLCDEIKNPTFLIEIYHRGTFELETECDCTGLPEAKMSSQIAPVFFDNEYQKNFTRREKGYFAVSYEFILLVQ